MNKQISLSTLIIVTILSVWNVWFMFSFELALVLGALFSISLAIFQKENDPYIETIGYAFGYAFLYILVFGVFVIIRGVYCDLHASKTILNSQPARAITFSDETKSVHYQTGATETTFSEVYSTEEKYFKMKSNYLQNNNCNVYSYNLKYDNILDSNTTAFECD